jgi:hypothetical protein
LGADDRRTRRLRESREAALEAAPHPVVAEIYDQVGPGDSKEFAQCGIENLTTGDERDQNPADADGAGIPLRQSSCPLAGGA